MDLIFQKGFCYNVECQKRFLATIPIQAFPWTFSEESQLQKHYIESHVGNASNAHFSNKTCRGMAEVLPTLDTL